MSNEVTAACRKLQMPPTPKAVLMAMADFASDSGDCWPSIPTLCEWTCFSRRAVIDALAWLDANGAIKSDKSNGRHTRYCVTPNSFTKPVQQAHQCSSRTRASNDITSAAPAPDQCISRTAPVQQAHPNHQEPSRTIKKATTNKTRSANACPTSIKSIPVPKMPDDVNPQIWSDWVSLRKAKSSPITETVLKNAQTESAKAGLSLNAFLEIWCSRGSVGLFAEWLKPHERAGPPASRPSAAANFKETRYESTPENQLPTFLRGIATAGNG